MTWTSLVTSILLVHSVSLAFWFVQLSFIAACGLIALRRRQRNKPLMYEWAFKHLHAAILLMFHLLSHPMALWYHAFCAMLSWSTEPYMLME